MVQQFFSIPYELFTPKIISAINLFQVINCDENDYNTLEFIEQNTHEDIMVSIYKLDRNINPTKGAVKLTSTKFLFNQNKWTRLTDKGSTDNAPRIIITDDKLQYYCCIAVRVVCDIVCRNLKRYEDSHMLELMSSQEEDSDILFSGLTNDTKTKQK